MIWKVFPAFSTFLDIEVIFTIIGILFLGYWFLSSFKNKEKKKGLLSLIFIFLAALLGGRIYYFLVYWGKGNILMSFLNPFNFGLVSYGMIIGGIIGIFIVSLFDKKQKYSEIGKIFDKLVPGVALYIFFVRMGCFLFGDVPGIPSKFGILTTGYKFGEVVRHPVALYLSFSGLLIFIILHMCFISKNKLFNKRFNLEISYWFLILYSFNRFFIEFFALGHNYKYTELILWNLSKSQIILIIALFLGILGLIIETKKLQHGKNHD